MSARDDFDKAELAYRLEAREYNRVRLAFRDNKVSAEEFVAARARFNAALAAWDRAEADYLKATEQMSVGEKIRDLLGGGKFDSMTGATLYVQGENFLQFRLPPKFARDGINSVRITRNERGSYDMEFWRIGRYGLNARKVTTVANVFEDQLRAVFSVRTGLDTSL